MLRSKESLSSSANLSLSASDSMPSLFSEEEIESLKQNGLQLGTFLDCKWRDDSFRMKLFFKFFF